MIHHIHFNERKRITSPNIDVTAGSFALDSSPFKFETCRERFGRQWDEFTKGFYLKHFPDKGFSVATFLQKTEVVLKQSVFSEYAETNRDTILWIEPSAFWKSCRMRRSLLTIMVRAGMMYDPKKDNYEDALFSHEFVKPTKRAVMRFLYGFTKYVGPDISMQTSIESRGWKSIFDSHDEQFVKNCLQWPKDDAYIPVASLEGALWI